jgi:energy-coupling factor transporter ATP-binding protein EcfA2
MYISTVTIKNIRSLEEFSLKFNHGIPYAGWHVVIGDNGSGKSTLIKSIALALIGPTEIQALRESWGDWLRDKNTCGEVSLSIELDKNFDMRTGKGSYPKNCRSTGSLRFIKNDKELGANHNGTFIIESSSVDFNFYIWGSGKGWFSASFGPFRRFTGGNKEWEKLFYSHPKLAPHLSAFNEDVALSESLAWLKDIHIKQLENKLPYNYLPHVIRFINDGGLLPHNTTIDDVDSDDVYFTDGNASAITVNQLSDGYRSVLSMTFELIRLMVNVYGAEKVFSNIEKGEMNIPLPGVVLIDEIDAHLHPSWQKRIGSWFCTYFPQIQFIVTTHSPLICHAAETGSVWRLAAPGSQQTSGRVRGTELKRLIYGNILESYDTQLFGENVTRSQSSTEKLERLAKLNAKSIKGKITENEKKNLDELRTILPTGLDQSTKA